jgi:lipopolysaccharide export system ATP-binding protein
LEIARALVTDPALILLDEPFSGVDPKAVADVQDIIVQLKEKGLGVLITDHNVRETLQVTDRAYIIFEGRVLQEGTADFLLNDPVTRDAYLGDRFNMQYDSDEDDSQEDGSDEDDSQEDYNNGEDDEH